MSGLVPFEKRNRGLGDLSSAGSNLEMFFDRFMQNPFAPLLYDSMNQMRVDIRETDDEYILEADLPGVTRDQINLEINEDQLVISVVEDEKKEIKKEGYICRERRCGKMMRSFPISNIQSDRISGKLENGTLSVTLPKKEAGKSKSHRIDIS